MLLLGPTMPTLAVQQVGRYLGYTGRDANVLGEAVPDPKATCGAEASAHACHKRVVSQVEVASGFARPPGH
jgi:hypothetical protein